MAGLGLLGGAGFNRQGAEGAKEGNLIKHIREFSHTIRAMNSSAKKRRLWYLLLIFIISVLALMWGLQLAPGLDSVDCEGLSPEVISLKWNDANSIDRRRFVPCITGDRWNGSALKRFEVQQSRLAGMNQTEVEVFLGPAERIESGYLRYDLGAEYASKLGRLLSIGWPEPTRSFCIQFSEDTGLVEQLYIGGQ